MPIFNYYWLKIQSSFSPYFITILAVDQLFSQKWKEDQQQMQQQQLTVASHVDSSGYSKQGDSRQFTFIPIGRTEPSDPKAPRTHPAQPTRSCILQSGGKAWPTAFALPGQVPSPMQSMRPPVDEEDEYYWPTLVNHLSLCNITICCHCKSFFWPDVSVIPPNLVSLWSTYAFKLPNINDSLLPSQLQLWPTIYKRLLPVRFQNLVSHDHNSFTRVLTCFSSLMRVFPYTRKTTWCVNFSLLLSRLKQSERQNKKGEQRIDPPTPLFQV